MSKFNKENCSSDPIIIIGGGQAAVQLCIALRKLKVSIPILILSEEAEYPYHRPPLSKSYLTGETTDEKLAMRPESYYSTKNITLKLNSKVISIDTGAKNVTTDSDTYRFQSLVIATGTKPRMLPLPGIELPGVNVLRDLKHSKNLKKAMSDAQRIAVIGAGFIGLEFAAVANKLGKQVTVFDMSERVMARAVSPDVSMWFEAQHRSLGIDIRLNESVSEIIGNNNIEHIKSTSGDVLDCDLLLMGIGVLPNDEIAKEAGIECNNGVVVDEFCQTSIPNVYAAGDCANHPNPFAAGAMSRLESIQNATDQARTVASTIAGNKTPYESVPWFWSDQGEHSLQMTGLSNSADTFVTRGNPSENKFSVFHFLGDKLQAVDSVNSSRDHVIARKLITAKVSPSFEQAADSEFDLKSLVT